MQTTPHRLCALLLGAAAFVMPWCGTETAVAAVASTTTFTQSGHTLSIDQHQDSQGIPTIPNVANDWPAIVSKAAVVMDMTTGTVVYEKAPLERHFPASITKILTAKIALDKGRLTDVLTTSELAAKQDGNRVYLVPGETEPLEKLLYGLLLNSGNDAAVVIAEHYGGTIQGFAHMMNETAEKLGATHSHFDNPNGLPDPNHYTTAYDMALIAKSTMANPEFRKIVATKRYNWHGKAWSSTLVNLNRMLFTYEGAIGVKTGYTVTAHETLVVAATRGDTTFLAVLMDAPLDRQIRDDATHLLDYAFRHFYTQTILRQGDVVGQWVDPLGHHVTLTSVDDVFATEPKGTTLQLRTRIAPPPTTSLPASAQVAALSLQSDNGWAATVPVRLSQPFVVPHPQEIPRPWMWCGVLLVAAPIMGMLTRLYLLWRRQKTQSDGAADRCSLPHTR